MPPKPVPKDSTTEKSKQPTYNEKDVDLEKSQPKMGDKNDKGQIYIEGFGWVKDEGGGSKGTKVHSDGDINKQIGKMN